MMFSPRPGAFVIASSDQGTLIVNRNDFWEDSNKLKYGVGFQILNLSSYDGAEMSALLTLLTDRKTAFGAGVQVVDCGANIGVFTVECARFVYGWGEVLAIEPQERVYYALAGNLAINNCFNARAMLAAVGSEVGMISVPNPNYILPSNFGGLELRKTETTEFIGQTIDYSEQKCNKVDLTTIDALNLSRVDLIKLYAEGMELEALEGALETIEKWKPLLFVERVKVDQQELRRWLEAHDYLVNEWSRSFLAIHTADPTLKIIGARGQK